MGKITITVPDDLEKRFREAVKEKYGTMRGALSIASKEAIDDWIKNSEKKEE